VTYSSYKIKQEQEGYINHFIAIFITIRGDRTETRSYKRISLPSLHGSRERFPLEVLTNTMLPFLCWYYEWCVCGDMSVSEPC